MESGGAFKAKTHKKGRDVKQPASIALRVVLVQTGDVATPSDRVLHGQSVAVALHPDPVDDYSHIQGEPCKCHVDVVIQCPLYLVFVCFVFARRICGISNVTRDIFNF